MAHADAESVPTPVKSADRVLTILELFSADPRPRGYSELLAETGLPKSSLHGLLTTLAARSWLTESRPGPLYTLGIRALEAGGAYMRGVPRSGVQTILDELAGTVGEAVNMAALVGSEIVYLAVRPSRHPLSLRSAVGVRLPGHATAMGKVMLAGWSDAEIRDRMVAPFTRLARNTCSDVEALLHDIEKIRARGYAVEFEESTDGVGCIAVAVDEPKSKSDKQYAVSVSFPVTRHEPEMERQIIDALSAASAQLRAAFAVDPSAEIA